MIDDCFEVLIFGNDCLFQKIGMDWFKDREVGANQGSTTVLVLSPDLFVRDRLFTDLLSLFFDKERVLIICYVHVRGLPLPDLLGHSSEDVELVDVSVNYLVVQAEKVLFPFSARTNPVLIRTISLSLVLSTAVSKPLSINQKSGVYRGEPN